MLPFQKSDNPKLFLISIDSLDSRYLQTDNGFKGLQSEYSNIMPNVNHFLSESTYFPHARCWLPAATEMNHLNAVAGTNSNLTGIIGVSIQLSNWDKNGNAVFVPINLNIAKDHEGKPIHTIFNSYKMKWPNSKTFIISGTNSITNMFRYNNSGVDILIDAIIHPEYITPLKRSNKFYINQNDRNFQTNVSKDQKLFSKISYEIKPRHFPPDKWVVNSAIDLFNNEKPDFGLIILAQMDYIQHAFGTAWDHSEFSLINNRLISKINRAVYKDAIINAIHDIDYQFGRLVNTIKNNYDNPIIVLYSDHGHATTNSSETAWKIIRRSIKRKYNYSTNTDVEYLLKKNHAIPKNFKNFKDFSFVGISSMGLLNFKKIKDIPDNEKIAAAKRILSNHILFNKQKMIHETPWYVFDRNDMVNGIRGICDPKELSHDYYMKENQNESEIKIIWPDLIILCKENWQIPVDFRFFKKLGLPMPNSLIKKFLPWYTYLGTHGGPDTNKIIMAFSGPMIPKGNAIMDEVFSLNFRISDIAITLSKILNIHLINKTIGQDLSRYFNKDYNINAS